MLTYYIINLQSVHHSQFAESTDYQTDSRTSKHVQNSSMTMVTIALKMPLV